MKRLIAGIGLGVALHGCSVNDASDQEISTINIEAPCTEWASWACDVEATCDPTFFRWVSQEACVADKSLQCVALYGSPFTGLTADDIQECVTTITAISTASCIDAQGDASGMVLPQDCKQPVGQAANGVGCTQDHECASGNCERNVSQTENGPIFSSFGAATCGTCEAAPALGEACGLSPEKWQGCGPDAVCEWANAGPRVCIAKSTPREVGEYCGSGERPCADGLVCDGTKTCATAEMAVPANHDKGLGETCHPNAGRCAVTNGIALICSGASQTCIEPVGLDGACESFDECGPGMACRNSICEPYFANAGEPCGILVGEHGFRTQDCSPTLYCDMGTEGAESGVCAPSKSEGDSCIGAGDSWGPECALPLSCVDSVCAMPTAPVCPERACGDNRIEGPETCEDSNQSSNDGCFSCGVEFGWECRGNPSVCDPVQCGNGLVQTGEQCDDQNGIPNDGCSANCLIAPGYVCTGEPSECAAMVCGDSFVDGAEVCDDGNTLDGDGCSSSCDTEAGWACFNQGLDPASPQCVNGLAPPELCERVHDTQCHQPICGDTQWDYDAIHSMPLEECDDGNSSDGDGCSATCTIEEGWSCNPFFGCKQN